MLIYLLLQYVRNKRCSQMFNGIMQLIASLKNIICRDNKLNMYMNIRIPKKLSSRYQANLNLSVFSRLFNLKDLCFKD